MANKKAIFSDRDLLTLLQLISKREISEHELKSDSGQEVRNESLESENLTERNSVPQRWELISEGMALYEWQNKCIPIWMKEGRGTVKIATGGGKTLFALAVAQELQNTKEPDLRLVIVVPTIPLMYQWRDEIRKGNIPESAVGLMGGGHRPDLKDLRILICVSASAREKLPDMIREAGWAGQTLLVVDECHHAHADQTKKIFDSNPKYRLGLSATPEPEDDSGDIPPDEIYRDSFAGRELGPIIYEFTIIDSLKAGLLTPFEIWHIGLKLDAEEFEEHARLSRKITDLRKPLLARYRRAHSKQGFMAWCQIQAGRNGSREAEQFIGESNRRKRILYQANARAEITQRILSEIIPEYDSRAIVFHESIHEVDELFLRLQQAGMPVVIEHSRLSDSTRVQNIDAFRRGIARMIVSAKSLVEGFNVPSADLGIIAASNSSTRQRIQSLGRMLRLKEKGRSARIYVLYIRDTTDESIFEKIDWDHVIGAERSRYFHWVSKNEDDSWREGLQEQSKPPKGFRPRPDAGVSLESGDLYVWRTDGEDLRVDHEGNLRDENQSMVMVSAEIIKEIVTRNPSRRARRTAAGHIIVRINNSRSDDDEWIYVGMSGMANPPDIHSQILDIKSISGRRIICRGKSGWMGKPLNASGPAIEPLLEWVGKIESDRHVKIGKIHWNGETRYWVEIQNERIDYPRPLSPLEFDQ